MAIFFDFHCVIMFYLSFLLAVNSAGLMHTAQDLRLIDAKVESVFVATMTIIMVGQGRRVLQPPQCVMIWLIKLPLQKPKA